MGIILYFGIPVLPWEGHVRKLMPCMEYKDKPGLVFIGTTKNTSFVLDKFLENFTKICKVDKPFTILPEESLYVNHRGYLFLANSKDATVSRKGIGKYDATINQLFQELGGGV